MTFHYLDTFVKWQAYGQEDRVYEIVMTPNGYFLAKGDSSSKLCRTHFEAIQWCETREAQCVEDDKASTIWENV